MNVEIRDSRFRDVVGDDAPLERLGTGFKFVEGAVWNHARRNLIFSDMPGDVMRVWTPDGRIETFRRPSGMANGSCYDRQGRLVTCEHATSRVTRTGLDGKLTVLASHYEGKELNSPNDVVVKSDGATYFTDPSFGRMEYYGVPRKQELEFQGVFRLDPEMKELSLLVSDFVQPNGLCFSLDEKRLFVNDTMKGHIRVFDVDDAGGLVNGRVWAEVKGPGDGVPDGLKIDSASNLFSAGPGGIHVFAPDATSLGVIHTPENVGNLTFGGPDWSTLFIAASTTVWALDTLTRSAPVPNMMRV